MQHLGTMYTSEGVFYLYKKNKKFLLKNSLGVYTIFTDHKQLPTTLPCIEDVKMILSLIN